jgi:uncharacterized protein (DUF1501 family)
MYTRRSLLRATAGLAGAAALGVPRRAQARVAGPLLKFVFVVNYGGWDPTRVFASALEDPSVSTEAAATAATAGGLAFVDHPERPSVRAWFERHAARSVVFNGMLVPSVAHEACLRLALTGQLSAEAADWGTLLAAAAAAAYPAPHVVLQAPSFPGPHGGLVTRTGSGQQLAALLSGDIAAWSDVPVARTTAEADAVMHAALARRVAAAAERARPGREAELVEGLRGAVDRAGSLLGLADTVAWSAVTFGEQVALAVDLLARGLTRVTTLAFATHGWDTHFDNDLHQSAAFEGLFAALLDLSAGLEARPGACGGTLADETVVVVLSEMGRAPALNAANGKDHWPYTSALVTGPNLAGGRVIGAFDALFYGKPVDFATGEVAEGAATLDAAALGATLLTLADLDPAEHLGAVEPVTAALA